jgi:hypothetical protein
MCGQRLHHQVPSIDALRRLAAHARGFGHQDLRPHRPDHAAGDLVLHLEDVGELAVVAVRPQVVAERGVDQLPGHAHAIGRLAHAALEHVALTHLACHLAHVECFALVGKAGVGDDEEPRLTRQPGDDVFGQAVGEVFLVRGRRSSSGTAGTATATIW